MGKSIQENRRAHYGLEQAVYSLNGRVVMAAIAACDEVGAAGGVKYHALIASAKVLPVAATGTEGIGDVHDRVKNERVKSEKLSLRSCKEYSCSIPPL